MIKEIALTPGIFCESSYAHPSACQPSLERLVDPVMTEVLLRNLHDGAWHKYIVENMDKWAPYAKHFVKNIITELRLKTSVKINEAIPYSDGEWCDEALGSHGRDNMNCIVTTAGSFTSRSANTILTSIEDMCTHPWWLERANPPVQVLRTIASYLGALKLILTHSNSILFIDAYLDPSEGPYRNFYQILRACSRKVAPPRIEIHRVCYYGRSKEIRSAGDWEKRFRDSLLPRLSGVDIKLEVFIWDDMHKRYLISNLMGLHVGDGFATTTRPGADDTWTRLPRNTSDSIQREFDPASKRHVLRHRFTLI